MVAKARDGAMSYDRWSFAAGVQKRLYELTTTTEA